MPDYGAVCDVSVLVNRDSVNRARELFSDRGFYLPNSTYSWLSHSRFIKVRDQAVGYSLLSQLVRTRQVYPILLPEVYNELARKIMFEVDHNVPLTDLRTAFLSTHLKLPLLTFDEKLIERLSNHIETYKLWSIRTHANWLAIRQILELYREFLFGVGEELNDRIGEKDSFSKIVSEVKSERRERLQKITSSIQKISQGQTNPGTLKFQCLAWNIQPSIREYLDQHVLEPGIIRELCERALILTARPD